MKEEFLIVNKRILPDYFEKVIEVRNLLRDGRFDNIREACASVGISRSTYYKYKDDIYPLDESNELRKAVLSMNLEHQTGVLSKVLGKISSLNCSILTISQSLPIGGKANVVLTLDITNYSFFPEELIQSIQGIGGVYQVELVSIE